MKCFVKFQKNNEDASNNYSYFPVVLKDEQQLLDVQKALNEKNVFPRRYFYPSLDTLSYIEPKQVCEISRSISKRILCLPLYPELSNEEQVLIIKIVKESL